MSKGNILYEMLKGVTTPFTFHDTYLGQYDKTFQYKAHRWIICNQYEIPISRN